MYQNRNTVYTSQRRRSTSTRTYNRNSNVARFKPSEKLGPVMGGLMVAGIFGSMGMIYLQNATKPNTYGKELQEIDAQILENELIRADLEVENARLTSLNSIKSSEVAQKMTKPASVSYAE